VLVGAALCAVSTLSMAVLGCVQEMTFSQYGQHHEEALFYIHAFGVVPLFLLQGGAPLARLTRWLTAPGPPLNLGGVPLPPRLWLLLALNLLACQACKKGFFGLLGATSALSATLGVLGYRFLGICISAFYFNAPPSPPPMMIAGIGLVTAGGLGYLSYSQPAGATPAARPKRD